MAKGDAIMEALGILAETASTVYQTQAERQFRENESALDRIHEKSQLYLTNSLNMLTNQIEQRNELKTDAAKLGLTDMDLTKVDSLNTSSGSKNVIQTQIGTTIDNLNYVNSEIDALANDVGNYYKGLSLGRLIDTDISGVISTEGAGNELDAFAQTEAGKEYAGLIDTSSAFNLGVQSYTLDPMLQSQLKLEKEQLFEYEVKNLYLPYKTDLEKKKADLAIGKQTLENLKVTKDEIVARTANIESQTALNELSAEELGVKIDSDEFAYDQSLRDNAKQNVGEMITLNYQMQGELGAHILSNINLQYEDSLYVPFMAIIGNEAGADLTGDDEDLAKILEAKQFSRIKGDINVLINAYTMGKTDPSVQDWAPVLAVLKKIKADKDVFDKYVKTSSEYNKMNASGDFSDKNMKLFYEEVQKSNIPHADKNKIVASLQWDRTGIFTPNSLKQFKRLEGVEYQLQLFLQQQEQIMMVDSDASAQIFGSINTQTYQQTGIPFIRKVKKKKK